MTRKITMGLANISQGLQECLFMGNLDAKRDWGHARDYVRMQWLMLQQEDPVDYVIASGVHHSVREFISMSAKKLGVELEFIGSGIDEVGVVREVSGDLAPFIKSGMEIVRVDPRYFRPTEVEELLGDPSKAREELGWVPEISLKEMCHEMMESDLEEAKKNRILIDFGHDLTISRED